MNATAGEPTLGTEREIPPLPLAFEWIYEFPSPFGGMHRKLDSARWNGNEVSKSYRVYTADQMHAYARAAIAVQSPAASQPVIAATVKRWCETCEGTGYVFQEPQAGCHVGGDHPCPDCDEKVTGCLLSPPQRASRARNPLLGRWQRMRRFCALCCPNTSRPTKTGSAGSSAWNRGCTGKH